MPYFQLETNKNQVNNPLKRIGSGEDTNPWNENWLPREGSLRPVACLAPDPPERVSDLISLDATWDMSKLEKWFLPMDIEAIHSIPICTRRQTDFWAWQFDRSGLFTVRSAYKMLVSTKFTREAWLDGRATGSNQKKAEKQWSSIWKTAVPSKIRTFVWRLAKHSIPTADVLHSRNMSTTDVCAICGQQDSCRHSLIDCNMARCVRVGFDVHGSCRVTTGIEGCADGLLPSA